MTEFIWDESEWPNLEAARRSLGQEHAVNDEELIAEARRVADRLRLRAGALDRLAAEVLRQTADRLGESVTTTAPEVTGPAWCKGCNHATLSEPCPKCGNPACAKCGRCPWCDGPVPDKGE